MRSRVELADLWTLNDEISERSCGYQKRRARRRGNSGGSGAASTPLTIITSVPVLQWVRSDLNVTQAGTVSQWDDQTANAYHFTQATSGKRPAYTASDATLNNRPTITGDGVDDDLANASIPNGSSIWISGIVKVVTWVAGRQIWGKNTGGTECGDLYMVNSSPNLALYNGTPLANINGGLPEGTWGRVETHLIDSAACYLKLRSTVISTGSAGGLSATGCALFSSAGATFGNVAIAERVVCSGKPTAPEITALDAYFTALYGVGLT